MIVLFIGSENRKGIFLLVDVTTEDEAQALMETLPLAKEQLNGSRVHSRRTPDADEGLDGPRSTPVTLLAIALPEEVYP